MNETELNTPKQERSKQFLQRKLDRANQRLREADAALNRVLDASMRCAAFFWIIWMATGNDWWTIGMIVSVLAVLPCLIWFCRLDTYLRAAQADIRDQMSRNEFLERLSK